MGHDTHHNAEELLEHSRWIRELARRLVSETDADDLVQDTWTAALTHPERRRGKNLRAWLGSVAKNLAGDSHRSTRHRRDREASVASSRADGGALPSPAELVSRSEEQRAVVDAVLALDEPYRSTLLLRYFEGMAPREMAALQGEPEATVRTRLHRGVTQVREALDARHGGDRATWAVALLPLAHHAAPVSISAATGASAPSHAAPTLKSVLLMSAPAKSSSSAVLLLAATFTVLASLAGAWAYFGPGASSVDDAQLEVSQVGPEDTVPEVKLSPVSVGMEQRDAAVSQPAVALGKESSMAPPLEPWTATAMIIRTDAGTNGQSPSPVNGMIVGLTGRFTVRALPEAQAPDSLALTEDRRVRLKRVREQEWSFSVADREVEKLVLACMLGDLVVETRIANEDSPNVEFRVDAASLAKRATGSIRYRVMTNREGDNGGATGKKIFVGMAAGPGVEFSKGAMFGRAEGEWHEFDRIPTSPVQLLVRGHNGIAVERRFQLAAGQQLDLGTIYTDEPWDFVFFQLRDEAGELVELDGSTLDLRTGWKQGGWQAWGEPGNYVLTTRTVHSLGIRVDAPGWSEIPMRVGRDQIHSGHPEEVQKQPFVQLTPERASTITWSLTLASTLEEDYVVLRELDGSPIRSYAANEVETVVSFLPAGTYRWTHHRDTGTEIGRIEAAVVKGAGHLALRM